MRGRPSFKAPGAGQRHTPSNLLWWEHQRVLERWEKMTKAEKAAAGGQAHLHAAVDRYAAAVRALKAGTPA